MKEDKINATTNAINIWEEMGKCSGIAILSLGIVLIILIVNPLGLEDCSRYCYSDPCNKANMNKLLSFLVPCMLIISLICLILFGPMVRKSD